MSKIEFVYAKPDIFPTRQEFIEIEKKYEAHQKESVGVTVDENKNFIVSILKILMK